MSITTHGSLGRKEKHQLVVKRHSSSSRNLGDSSLGRLTTSEGDIPTCSRGDQTNSILVGFMVATTRNQAPGKTHWQEHPEEAGMPSEVRKRFCPKAKCGG